MKNYEKKIKRTLFFFLALLSLLINITTFYIITSSLKNKYIELSQTHMEHQYQNFQQQMALLEQHLLLFSTNNQLSFNVKNKDKIAVLNKIQNFKQSSPNIKSLYVFTSENGNSNCLASEKNTNYNYNRSLTELLGITYNYQKESIWYIMPNDSSGFFYICPLIYNDFPVGYLVAEIDIQTFMKKIFQTHQYYYWDEYMALASDSQILYEITSNLKLAYPTDFYLNSEYQTRQNVIYIAHELINTDKYLIQAIVLQTNTLYFKIAAGLLSGFSLSLFGIHFIICRFIRDIMSKLYELKEKMSKITVSTQ